MTHRLRLAIIVVIVVVAAGLAWYLLFGPPAAQRGKPPPLPTRITASGFIEATDVNIASEVSGRITAINAAEGDAVHAGDVLVKLDDSLLLAQVKQGEAAVTVAKMNLQQGLVSRDGAKRVLDSAQDIVNNPLTLDSQITAAKGQLDVAQLNLDRAQQLNPLMNYWDYNSLIIARDTAQKVLDNLNAMKADPQDAKLAVDRAQTAYDQAGAQVDVLNAQVAQALAPLDVLKVQLARMSLAAPVSGVVRLRNAEVGEMAQVGMPILVLTKQDPMTLTVYVADTYIGLVKLGQVTDVEVDSYPSQTFAGNVTFIADQAEFTPRNIQIKSERTKTVYAVKITLPNSQLKLKAGMPADATIVVG